MAEYDARFQQLLEVVDTRLHPSNCRVSISSLSPR